MKYAYGCEGQEKEMGPQKGFLNKELALKSSLYGKALCHHIQTPSFHVPVSELRNNKAFICLFF